MTRVVHCRVVVVALLTCCAMLVPSAAHAYTGTGYDISYPQCGVTLPASATFVVLGATGGTPYRVQPCLTAELRWAERTVGRVPSFYANTANPGRRFSTHWPAGQTSPRVCRASSASASTCSYDYGWNATVDAFNKAVAAKMTVGGLTHATAKARVAGVMWWLDVETSNSWETLEAPYGQTASSRTNDTMSVLGSVGALAAEGVAHVGIYSTAFQWKQITGGLAVTLDHFVKNPVWLAGFSNRTKAAAGCKQSTFTGAKVMLTQYISGSFDRDYACP